MITKEQIVKLLATDNRAIVRALIVLNERQTSDEQAAQVTKFENGRGFRPCHAHMGTSMVEFFQKYKYLSTKQISYWRKENSKGDMRIAIYWRQLMEAAEQKSQKTPVKKINGGNLKEEYMMLKQQYSQADDLSADRIADRMIQIKEQMEEINRMNHKFGLMA